MVDYLFFVNMKCWVKVLFLCINLLFVFVVFMLVMKEICKLLFFFLSILFKKFDVNNIGLVIK